ncbi:MAG TPA: RecX family transcriptional regulator [Anaerolineales bacterium]|nr:RecX family transcriptional regulator [Anaerolineales bacterium]
MKRITAIEAQKNNPHRVNVYLDGEFAFGLAKITAAWLKTGQALDEAKIAQLQAEDAQEKAYQQAMLFLGYRARSEAEVRKNLEKHEVPPAVIERTVERLREERLLNDGQFARDWVANRSEFRPRSRRALAIELRRKGVDEAAIQSATETTDETTLAYAAAQKRARRLEGLEWLEFRKKLSGFLARRGFDYEVIAPTVKRLWLERDGGQDTNFDNEEFP